MEQIALRIGATLRGGTYRIDSVLGQGGFGITYLATDLSLDRNVAIKEFFPKDYCDRNSTTSHVTLGTKSTTEFVEKLKKKFLKEAKNIAKFDHPNIIKIHAAFEENNTAYYVMDFIKGESLSDRVKRAGVLSLAESLQYVSQVGAALEYVHSFKMNHLDVKPANIMVREADNCPILIDFGLSKQYDRTGNQTSTTPVGISHGYAPMEQYNDGGVGVFSPTTDEYSLAATLYYLLSGITPPQSTKLVENELIFPQSIPVNLITPISKAMSPARKDRYATVGQFLAALKSAAVVEPERTIPVKPEPKPTPKPVSQPKPQPSSSAQEKKSDRSSQKRLMGIVGGLMVVALIMVYIWQPWSNPVSGVADNDSIALSKDSLAAKNEKKTLSVSSMFFHHSLGDCSYTGEVDENQLPHGKGVAKWTSGNAKQYDGMWVHGVMEGQTVYSLRNGDVFEGTFKGDKYYKGRYTIKETGESFEGTFKDGSPDVGSWFDKNGKQIE